MPRTQKIQQPVSCPKLHCDDLMVIAAFRYCLGRRSYIVGACVAWILALWPKLTDNTTNLIVHEINEAAKRDGGLGMSFDVQDWARILYCEEMNKRRAKQ